MTKCELCGFENEDLLEKDDCNGQPHLVCERCWENLGNDSYEPTVVE
jgi:hypothetical protein